jgi:hypothetical protein
MYQVERQVHAGQLGVSGLVIAGRDDGGPNGFGLAAVVGKCCETSACEHFSVV